MHSYIIKPDKNPRAVAPKHVADHRRDGSITKTGDKQKCQVEGRDRVPSTE